MNIYLAPMEGVVDPVIREIFSKIGGYDQMTTEFIRVTSHLHTAKIFYKYCPELLTQGKTKYGTPVYVQLLGSDPTTLAENAALAQELGAPGIDLNFGCPAPRVNSHDGGAALLQKPERLFHILNAVIKALPKGFPVTAKVRLGFNDKTLVSEIARAIKEAKATRLTVHARTKLEGYKPPAHWEYIAQIKEIISPIPTIANGEIWTVKDYLNCIQQSQCTDVALGRGAFAQPFLALAIKKQSPTESIEPWSQFLNSIVPEFIQLSTLYRDSAYALARTKQWLKFLARNYPDSLTLFESIKTYKNIADLGKHNLLTENLLH